MEITTSTKKMQQIIFEYAAIATACFCYKSAIVTELLSQNCNKKYHFLTMHH